MIGRAQHAPVVLDWGASLLRNRSMRFNRMSVILVGSLLGLVIKQGLTPAYAQTSILIERAQRGDSDRGIPRSESMESSESVVRQPRISQQARDEYKSDDSVSESSTEVYRGPRVGAGALAGSVVGGLGAQLELKLGPEQSLQFAFGGGSGFSVFGLSTRNYFSQGAISPFWSLGLTRWSGSGEAMGSFAPNYLSERLLSDSEESSGRWQKVLGHLSAGAQFNLLTGPSAGNSIFLSADVLLVSQPIDAIPTLGLGWVRYF